MKSQRGEASTGGIGLFGLLGVVFITLKILEIAPVAGWSWWLVTLPIWGGAAFVFAVLMIIAVIAALAK